MRDKPTAPITIQSNKCHTTTCAHLPSMLSYMHNRTNNTMTIFHTSNHDMSMVTSQTEQLPTDAELKQIEDIEINVDTWIDDMMMGIIEDIQY